jgi:cytochrome c553
MDTFTWRDYSILVIVVTAAFAVGFCLTRARGVDSSPLQAGDWLLRAPSETERLRLLERQLRGFDLAMWEVGERFGFLHDALARRNYEFAIYQWDKIGVSVENALVRRPSKELHANQFLLGRNFQQIRTAFASKEDKRAWAAFNQASVACQACHGAEGVAYVNAAPLFELARPDNRTQ